MNVLNERMAMRHDKKSEIAKLRVQLDRAVLLDRQAAELNNRIEAAAASHLETCGPVQAEISEIEAQMTEQIVDRKQINPKAESRRIALLEIIATANEALEAELAKLKKLRAAAVEESTKLKVASKEFTVFENHLCRDPLVNPDLLNQMHSAQIAMEFCELRVNRAKSNLERCEANRRIIEQNGDKPENVSSFVSDLERCMFERNEAGKLRNEAVQRMEKLRQNMLEE